MSRRQVLAHATAVLPGQVLEDAQVVLEDGLIAEVGRVRPGAVPAEAVDLRGALLLPGLVDTHSDGLEKELRPRPTAEFDPDFAVASFEGRVHAAGVTTVFHGIGYQTDGRKNRTVDSARRMEEAVAARAGDGTALIDHRLLLRLDARDPGALEALRSGVARHDPAGRAGPGAPPLVSFEDHTPGQGQYADAEYYEKWLAGTEGITAAEARSRTADHTADRETRAWHRDVAFAWLSEQAEAGRIRLLAHDPASAAEIHAVRDRGVAVAEFPTTLEAARAAASSGLLVVAGAPNVLRGGSHSGNVAARDLIAADLVDGLSSDYLPSSLLAAVLRLASDGVVPLPRAVSLVTSGPAAVAGLADRGALIPGLRGDVIAVTVDRGWPTVRLVHSAQPTPVGAPA